MIRSVRSRDTGYLRNQYRHPNIYPIGYQGVPNDVIEVAGSGMP
jgi:hypothetical protein